jgi:hypothetical protein
LPLLSSILLLLEVEVRALMAAAEVVLVVIARLPGLLYLLVLQLP